MIIENVLIISLKSQQDRRDHSIKQCKKVGIKNIILIDAIDGKKENIDSHLACTMSHIKAWKYVLDNKIKNYIIVEDDIIFSNEFLDIILKIDILNIEWDILLFGYFGLANYYKKYPICEQILFNLPFVGRSLYRNQNSKSINENLFIPESPLGLHCYTINNESVEKIINMFNNPYNLPDVMLNLFGNKINIIAVYPELAFQDIRNFSSTLAYYNILVPLFNRFDCGSMPLGWRLSHYGKKILDIPITGFVYLYCCLIFILILLYFVKIWTI